MSFRVQDSLAWIARALGIDRVSSPGQLLDSPREVLDTIQPVVFAKGWQAALSRGSFLANVPGVTNSAAGPSPPLGESWLVVAANVSHGPGGAAKNIRIDLFDNEQASISGPAAIVSNSALAANVFMPIPRPILLNHGQILAAESQQAILAGDAFTLRGHFIRLAAGEYLPGSPYG